MIPRRDVLGNHCNRVLKLPAFLAGWLQYSLVTPGNTAFPGFSIGVEEAELPVLECAGELDQSWFGKERS